MVCAMCMWDIGVGSIVGNSFVCYATVYDIYCHDGNFLDDTSYE